jgi:hypothetical protein
MAINFTTPQIDKTKLEDALRQIGVPIVDQSRILNGNGWRMRIDGGVIIFLYDDGRLRLIGKNSRRISRALGIPAGATRRSRSGSTRCTRG